MSGAQLRLEMREIIEELEKQTNKKFYIHEESCFSFLYLLHMSKETGH